MRLSSEEFKKKLQNNQLVISLIGMSNLGKTHWSKKLRNLDFSHICCDDLIEAILEPELKSLGYAGLADMAKWLGHPYEKQFQENQQKYLQHEISVMQKILEYIANRNLPQQNLAIDTTGSVIYTGDKICNELKEKSLIVYIEATPEMQEKMFQRFLENPKPIVWSQSFQKKSEESDMEALKRCYPELLKYRSAHYKNHADVIIPHAKTADNPSAEDFLDLIKSYL